MRAVFSDDGQQSFSAFIMLLPRLSAVSACILYEEHPNSLLLDSEQVRNTIQVLTLVPP